MRCWALTEDSPYRQVCIATAFIRFHENPDRTAARRAFSLTFPVTQRELLINVARGRPQADPVRAICGRS
jgi:hypothetical protein